MKKMPQRLFKGLGGFGAILFLLGVLASVIAAFMSNLPFTAVVLAITGVLVGLLNVTSKESLSYLVAVIAIALTSGTIASLPAIGGIAEAILVNLTAFAGAAALVVGLGVVFRTASK